jgi:hypothetical protein
MRTGRFLLLGSAVVGVVLAAYVAWRFPVWQRMADAAVKDRLRAMPIFADAGAEDCGAHRAPNSN